MAPGSGTGGRSPLLVPPTADRVHEAHDGHYVGQVVPRYYLMQELHVDEARVAVVHPIWRVRTVGDDVHRELAPRALDAPEALALGRPDAAAHVRHHSTLGHLLEALLDDLDALQALPDSNPVRSLNIARRVGYDVELQLGVDTVGVVESDVEVDAGAPQGRPGQAHLDGLLLRHLGDAAGTGDEDLVSLDEINEVRLEVLLQALYETPDLLRDVRRQIRLDPPDADVVEHHPRASHRLEDALYALPLPKGVEDRGERPELEQQEPDGRDVARQPHELAHQHPDVLRPRRDLHIQEILDRKDVAVLVVHVGEVVEPVGHGDDGRVHAVLGDLLLAPVQIPHDRVAPHHGLPVELQDQPQEPVHRGVLRAHV